MKKNPLVYIIILNWNGIQETIDCLESLKKIDYVNYKIVVVDNGSIDNSVSILEKNYPNIDLLKNEKNEGYAGGNNSGIEYVLKYNPDYVLFLNNDTVVSKDFLITLVSVAQSDPNIGIVGPKIYYFNKPEIIWFTGGKIDYVNGPFIHLDMFKKDTNANSKTKEVDYINGCSLLIKSSVLKKIGGFGKKYFAYVEDIDINMHAHRLGYTSYIVPSAKIWHKPSSSTGGEKNPSMLREYLKTRNLIFFMKTNYHGKEKLLRLMQAYTLKVKEIYRYITYLNVRIPIAIIQGLVVGIFY